MLIESNTDLLVGDDAFAFALLWFKEPYGLYILHATGTGTGNGMGTIENNGSL